MFFDSIKEINRLRKEINRLLSKGMSNTCLKVSIVKKNVFKTFHKLKTFVSWTDFGKLQLTQISLNFKTFCYNLKSKRLEAKLCVPFLLF